MSSDPVPIFPEFRDITIDDKEVFDLYLANDRPSSSEYTFANFFCWRKCGESRITKINGNLCVLANGSGDELCFREPIGGNKIEETVRICADHLIEKGYKPRLIKLNKEFVAPFLKKKEYVIKEDRDNFDYIYLTKELIELKGKRFDGKRNRISKFKREYKSNCAELTLAHIPKCLDLLERWKAEKKGLCIDEPIREALHNFDKLKLQGLVVFVEDKIEAFTIGEKMDKDTAVVYIEVANPRFAGLAQFINQKFSEELSDCKYINREQDLGDAGLRRAKLSYYPSRLIDKYTMTLK
ncbi:DUF2156 domain-containing protein [Candidatus Margulisiibacteriota bacterium]